MYAQYTVVPRVGSVTVGIAKSISSVTIFVTSHYLFCSDDEKGQCINIFKLISLGIVLSGVIMYNVGVMLKSKKTSYVELKDLPTD